MPTLDTPIFRSLTAKQLDCDPVLEEQLQFRERCLRTPLGLAEKLQRPWASITLSDLDEFDEQDICAAFARDIAAIASAATLSAGVPITAFELNKVPPVPAVYWLNVALDSEFQTWRMVYVGKATNLQARWAGERHHRHSQAVEWQCRLDWWEVPRGTEALIEAAMIYHFKPSWNERQ